jgi:hypothetical protein
MSVHRVQYRNEPIPSIPSTIYNPIMTMMISAVAAGKRKAVEPAVNKNTGGREKRRRKTNVSKAVVLTEESGSSDNEEDHVGGGEEDAGDVDQEQQDDGGGSVAEDVDGSVENVEDGHDHMDVDQNNPPAPQQDIQPSSSFIISPTSPCQATLNCRELEQTTHDKSLPPGRWIESRAAGGRLASSGTEQGYEEHASPL